MLVTVKYNQPVGDFRAVERTERFYAERMFETAGSSLLYFKVNAFDYRTVSKNELVSIEQKGR